MYLSFSFLFDFVAKTQNPSVPVPRFDEFTVPFLDDFVDGDRDELFICPSELFGSTFPGQSSIVLRLRVSSSLSMRKKRVSRNTFSFWLVCGLSSPLHIRWSPRRIVVFYGSGRTRLGRLPLPCYLRGTALSIRF